MAAKAARADQLQTPRLGGAREGAWEGEDDGGHDVDVMRPTCERLERT